MSKIDPSSFNVTSAYFKPLNAGSISENPPFCTKKINSFAKMYLTNTLLFEAKALYGRVNLSKSS